MVLDVKAAVKQSGEAQLGEKKWVSIVFDKTETLTVGKPVVVSAVLFSEFSMEEFGEMAIAVDESREHPIAKVVVTHAKRLCQKIGSCIGEVHM